MTRRTRSASRQPGPSKKRPRLAAPAREPFLEVIELTDSDNDIPVRRSPKQIRREPGPSQPSPSKTSNAAFTFGKPRSEMLADAPASVPGSSQHAVRPERLGDGGPLFLPGSDDEQRAIHPPPVSVAQEVFDAAPAHHPQPLPAAPQAPALVDEYIVRVLEIVPDVQPVHALALIEQFMQSQPENVVESVLQALFENLSYPKVDQKGKHKRNESDGDPNVRGLPEPKVDYTSKERVYDCGPHYFERSLVRDCVS